MLIKKHQKAKFAIREIRYKGAITNIDSTDHEQFRLSWVLTLANQIATLAPELLEKDTLNIIIAGAEQETIFPSVYQLLNTLLGSKMNFNVRLVGLEAHETVYEDFKINAPYQDSLVNIEVIKSSLGDELKRSGMPDLISLNSPGFESHHEEWLLSDDGILKAIDAGVIVIGGSYGLDEFAVDNCYLARYGLTQSEHLTNTFAYTPSQEHNQLPAEIMALLKDAVDRGDMDIMKTIWRLDNKRHEPSSALQDIYEHGAKITEIIMANLHEIGLIRQSDLIPYFNQYTLLFHNNDRNTVYIMSSLVYDFNRQAIYNTLDGDIYAENIDLSHFKIESFYDLAVFISHVHLNVIDVEDALEFLDSSFEVENDPSDLFDENVLLELFQGNTLIDCDMDNDEGGLGADFSEAEFVSFLKQYDIQKLEAFRNQDGYNLLNLACAQNSIPMIKALHEKGVSFVDRDNDLYSCLDTCATADSTDALKYLLENKLADKMINSPAPMNGFYPIIHAAMRGNNECVQLLKKHGADINKANFMGITAKQILEA